MNVRTKFLWLALVWSILFGNKSTAAIVYPKAPDEGQQVVSNSIVSLAHGNPTTLHGYQIKDVAIAQPFRTYSVGLTNLAQRRFLPAADSRSWHYIILHGTNAVGAVELYETEGHLKFAGLYETNFSAQTLEALRMAKQLPQILREGYEVRRLDVPAIHFVAVWLHRQGDDILIPLPPTFGRWNAYQVYSEKEMLKLLRPEAEKILNQPGLIN